MKMMYGKYVALVEMNTAKRKVQTNNVNCFKGRHNQIIKIFKNPNYKEIELKSNKNKIKLVT